MLGNLPDCGDTRGMLRLTEAVRDGVHSGKPVSVDIGEGGTTLRFGMAACASIPGLDITLCGSHRLMERPHSILVDALKALGAEIGQHPAANSIRVVGHTLSGGEICVDASISSQYLSAMMLAAPAWERDTIFRLSHNPVSLPYIRMTAGVMRAFGARVEWLQDDSQSELVKPEQVALKVSATGYPQCARFDIEGDWSGASYFFETRLIMQALGMEIPELTLPSLSAPAESLQGDSRVAGIFADAARSLRDSSATGRTDTIVLNLNDAPDLVPAIAVGFCVASLPFRIEGIAHLRHKETDRMHAITAELRRIGYVLDADTDSLQWRGKRCSREAEPMIRTYQDHRMAMAFAPARLAFPSLTVEDPSVVEKSFPGFWEQFNTFCHSIPNTKIIAENADYK